MRDTLLIIHILAAGTWIGGSLTVMFLHGRLRRLGHDTGAGFMASFAEMGRKYFPPAAIVILLSGILLVLDSDVFEFSNAFVIIGIAVVVAGAVLGSKGFDPIAKRAAAAHDEGNDAALDATYRRFASLGALDIALLVFAVIAMVTKLGL